MCKAGLIKLSVNLMPDSEALPRNNQIRDTRPDGKRSRTIGIKIDPKVGKVTLEDNAIQKPKLFRGSLIMLLSQPGLYHGSRRFLAGPCAGRTIASNFL